MCVLACVHVCVLSTQCSVSCGEGIQQRQVVCKASDNTISHCDGAKPDTILICTLNPCPGKTRAREHALDHEDEVRERSERGEREHRREGG